MTIGSPIAPPSLIKRNTVSGKKVWRETGVAYQNVDAELPVGGSITARYHTADGSTSGSETAAADVRADLTPAAVEHIFENSVRLRVGNTAYIDRAGNLYRDIDPATGSGVLAGTIDYGTGLVVLSSPGAGSPSAVLDSMLTSTQLEPVTMVQFRTPGAPVRPGSFSVQCQDSEGNNIVATADFNGNMSVSKLIGHIDVSTGIVTLIFGEEVVAAGNEGEDWYDADAVDASGNIWRPAMVWADTVKFSCVVYSYLPLDADLIGIDPVRLPPDGRVPIFRAGDIVLIHNTQADTMPAPLSAGQVVTLSRHPVSAVDMFDANDVYVPETYYTVDLTTGEITFADPLDLSAFSQPLRAVHRVEDGILCNDVQISGHITLIRGVENNYTAGVTYVSSILPFGDVRSRVHNLFDQETWTGVWSDDLIGDAVTANYDDVNYPIVTTNRGAVAQRWALLFDSDTHFDIVGEFLGVIGNGYTTNTIAPINPATGVPYFTMPVGGFGSGWSAGNVIRFNTDAANRNIWMIRTTLPGPDIEPTDHVTIQIRGDSD